MADPQDSQYDETRKNFEQLEVEEQASFLVEATATTIARGVLQAGEALSSGIEEVLRRRRSTSSHGPGAAEPETSQRRNPRSGGHDSDSES